MLAKLVQRGSPLTKADADRARHLLIILPQTDESAELRNIPYAAALEAALERRRKKLEDLRKSAITTDLPHGGLVAWVMNDGDDGERTMFER